RLSRRTMKEAELAARSELQPVVARFDRGNWQEAVGASGTLRAVAAVLRENGVGGDPVTAEELEWLRARLLKAGSIAELGLPGLKPDRRPVLAGGLAILNAVVSELGIESLAVSDGALRQGV